MISDRVAPDIATLSTTMSPSATDFPEAISPTPLPPAPTPKKQQLFFFFFFFFLPFFLEN
jgi:hypothetical protein